MFQFIDSLGKKIWICHSVQNTTDADILKVGLSFNMLFDWTKNRQDREWWRILAERKQNNSPCISCNAKNIWNATQKGNQSEWNLACSVITKYKYLQCILVLHILGFSLAISIIRLPFVFQHSNWVQLFF